MRIAKVTPHKDGALHVVAEDGCRMRFDGFVWVLLVGMLLAAAGGTAVLPEDWLVALPGREDIQDLATALVSWSQRAGGA